MLRRCNYFIGRSAYQAKQQSPSGAQKVKKTVFLSMLSVCAVFGVMLSGARAQSNTAPDDLFKTIQSLDTRFFDAYNHCDLATISSLVAEDLEFYHDKTGLARGRQSLVDGIKNNICGKVTRELVPGTQQVDPIANYGAVETASIASITTEMIVTWEKPNSSRRGSTKMAAGRLPVPSALTITLRGNRADRASPLIAKAH